MSLRPTLLQCPACGSTLTAGGIDPSRQLAKCAHCGALMALPTPPPAPADRDAGGFRPRPERPLPAKFHWRDLPGGRELSWRWFGPAAVFSLIFATVWNSFLVFWYGMATLTGGPWILFVFPLLHVAVGLVVAYTSVALFLNRTRIQVTFRELTVDHGPLPWPGRRQVPRDEIMQLYGKATVTRGKNGPRTTYTLWLQRRHGAPLQLVGGGLNDDQILALEQALERALQIPDTAVAGELPR